MRGRLVLSALLVPGLFTTTAGGALAQAGFKQAANACDSKNLETRIAGCTQLLNMKRSNSSLLGGVYLVKTE